MVVVIGRRRRAAYGRVVIAKGKKLSCTVSQNMAINLRIRQDDKIKVVPLAKADHSEDRSGDLVLLNVATPPTVKAVTFAPLEDSLSTLESSEGGDEISEEELMERFIGPYTADRDSPTLVKKGAVLTLRDDNGKKLDFMVSAVEVEGAAEEESSGKHFVICCWTCT
jgi:hypothetical protein